MNIRTDMYAQLYQDRQTFDLLRSLPASYAEALGKVSAWQKALLILSWSRRQFEGAGVQRTASDVLRSFRTLATCL